MLTLQCTLTFYSCYNNFHQGYCEDAQATANAFCGDFYLTGDRGVQDEVELDAQ